MAENGSPGGSWVAAEKGAAPDVVEAMRGCDVIHDLSCSTQVHVAACGPRGECAIPHLYTANGISWRDPAPPARHNVVVVSHAARLAAAAGHDHWWGTPLSGTEGFPGPPIPETRVVRYGCDLDFYRPSADYERDLVVYIGRPHEHKGLSFLPLVARLLPDLRFVCAWGVTSLVPAKAVTYLEKKFDGVRNLTILALPPPGPGHHEAKRDLLARAAVAIHPATYLDACPRTVIEAQSCGVPVAAFDRGGVPELVHPGRTGALAMFPEGWPLGDSWESGAHALAMSVRSALEMDREYVRRWAVAVHGAERMARDYLALYGALARGVRWGRGLTVS